MNNRHFKYILSGTLIAATISMGTVTTAATNPFFSEPVLLSTGELPALLEKWDIAVGGDKLKDKGEVLGLVSRNIPDDKRFAGSSVLRYKNKEIKDRVVSLYLKEIARSSRPPTAGISLTNPWNGGEGGADYLWQLLTIAESTFDPNIYEAELATKGFIGELRLLYLATVNPRMTLDHLLKSKRGNRGRKKGHMDYFYRGDTNALMSVDDAYLLLSLMSMQSPDVLVENKKDVIEFVTGHVKHYASVRKVVYKDEPVYLQWKDYDVRNLALDVLELLGGIEEIKLIESIIQGAPQIDKKTLNGGSKNRREQIEQKGRLIIEKIKERKSKQQLR